MPEDDSRLDGCDIEFDDERYNTDDNQIDAVTLFADVDWTDPLVVAERRREWLALFATEDSYPDDLPTTGAPDA